MTDRNNFIAIGKIVKQVGIKGTLKIIFLTDFPERFKTQKVVYLYDEKLNKFFMNAYTNETAFIITESNNRGKFLTLKFEHYDSIDASEKLINLILMINEKDRVKLEGNNYYYYELVDLPVFDNGKMIGTVKSVNNYGSDDILIIQSDESEVLVPLRNEFIKNINLESKRIDVELIEGFLEK